MVDDRQWRDARDDAPDAVAGRAREGIDLQELREEGRPAATGLGRRPPWRGDDGGRPVCRSGRRLTSHAAIGSVRRVMGSVLAPAPRRVKPSCCRCPTSMWCSRCPPRCGLVAAVIDALGVRRAIRSRQPPPIGIRSSCRAGVRPASAVKRPVAGRSPALQTP